MWKWSGSITAAWQAQPLSEQWEREDLQGQGDHPGQEYHQSKDRPQETTMGFLKDTRMEPWQTDLLGAALIRLQARTARNMASGKISTAAHLLRSLCHL
jgi:hypothetical protein